MKNKFTKIFAGLSLSLAVILPSFADTANLRYQANVAEALTISIEDADGNVLARDGETATLNFGNVDALGLNVSPSIDSVRLIKGSDLFDTGEVTDNDSAIYTIGSDTSKPTVFLRTRIQGGGNGKIEHTFSSSMDGMEIVFAPADTPWASANDTATLDPGGKLIYIAPGAAPIEIAGNSGVYRSTPMTDNELVGFDVALNVKPEATKGPKEAVSTFRLIAL